MLRMYLVRNLVIHIPSHVLLPPGIEHKVIAANGDVAAVCPPADHKLHLPTQSAQGLHFSCMCHPCTCQTIPGAACLAQEQQQATVQCAVLVPATLTTGPVSLNQESSWGHVTTVILSLGSMLLALATCAAGKCFECRRVPWCWYPTSAAGMHHPCSFAFAYAPAPRWRPPSRNQTC